MASGETDRDRSHKTLIRDWKTFSVKDQIVDIFCQTTGKKSMILLMYFYDKSENEFAQNFY